MHPVTKHKYICLHCEPNLELHFDLITLKVETKLILPSLLLSTEQHILRKRNNNVFPG